MKEKFEHSNPYKLITQLKSWMAINPKIGCSWDCCYCVQEKDDWYSQNNKENPKRVKSIHNIDDILEQIMTNPRITSRTPLALYNFTDPFLPTNTRDLKYLIKKLDNLEFNNIIGLVTRTNTTDDVLDTIADVKHLRIAILVSYAGYTNRDIENAPPKKRIDLMRKAKDKGIKVLQYARPLVNEWIEPGQIERISKEVKGKIDGVITSGIRITPEIINKIEKKGIIVPKTDDFEHKYLDENIVKEVIKHYKGIAPVFRYTSCAMSYLFGIRDYNAHYNFIKSSKNKEYECCPLPCTKEQKERCNEKNQPLNGFVRGLLKRIDKGGADYIIQEKGEITIYDNLNKAERSFIRQNTGYHVNSINKTNYYLDDTVQNR